MTNGRGWISLRVHPGSRRDAVLAALFESGAPGVEEVGEELITYAADDGAAEAAICAVLAASVDARVETRAVAPVDWTERWKQGIRAHKVGELVIAPPWATIADASRTIVIEPAMAFGTGEHATTRGVVRLLQSVVEPGDRVADLGAGTAVVAIAAVKLGAAHVAAIELDADAIGNAEANVRRNGVEHRVIVIEGDAGLLLPLVAPVRVVTANIISSVLLELLPKIAAALEANGRAILGGFLEVERAEMLRAFEQRGWCVEREDAEDGWWSATIARR